MSGFQTLVVMGTVVGEVSVNRMDIMADQMVVMVKVVVFTVVEGSLIMGVGALGKMLLGMFLTTFTCPLAREDGTISVPIHSGILLTSAVVEGG